MPIRIEVMEDGSWEVFHLGYGFRSYESEEAAIRSVRRAMKKDHDVWEYGQKEAERLEGKRIAGTADL